MTIPTDRLRELANGATIYGHERNEIATELLACREEREKHITAMAAIAQRHLDAVAERDAVTRHRDDLLAICQRDSDAAYEAVLSGRASKTKFGAMLVRDAVAELVEQRDAARAEAEKVRAELAAVKRQRDELLAALRDAEEVLALMERPSQEDPAYGAEVRALGDRIGFGALMASASASWRKRLPDGLGGEHVSGPCRGTVDWILGRVRKALAAEQPKPQQPEVQPAKPWGHFNGVPIHLVNGFGEGGGA